MSKGFKNFSTEWLAEHDKKRNTNVLGEQVFKTKPTPTGGEIVQPDAGKRAKYGNIKTEVDGIRFDSKKEAKRYYELKMLEKAGEITNLQLQVQFPLTINEVNIGKYIADFTYYVETNPHGFGRMVVEDAKGMKTPVYRLKKKLMKALYNIDILET